MHVAAVIVSVASTLVALALVGRAAATMVSVIRQGRAEPPGRTDHPAQRWWTLLRETVGHTRLARWRLIGVAHWFVAVGFFTLLLTIVNAIGQLFQADWILPVLGDWAPYNVFVEFIGTMTVLGILTLIVIRQLSHPRKPGRIEQALLLVEIPASGLLRKKAPLQAIGEAGDDILQAAELLVEIGAKAPKLLLVA